MRASPTLRLVVVAVLVATTARGARLSDLLDRADRDALHDHRRWRALLHYESRWYSSHDRSRVDTPSFFASRRGDRDARAELRATLRAFFEPGATVRDGEHPQCAFVARRHWLEGVLGLPTGALRTVECPAYERWRAGLDARGLTLVFPEGFMNNPASLFGHTLLRIDQGDAAGAEDLLGHAVDFTADARDDGLSYIVKGVLGLYPGYFHVRPYYQQLKRYADWENRDIWEYRLRLEPGELDFLLMHLWELRGVAIPYYFFTKNCSYELLRLLEIGVADLDASARFRGAVIPIDTVRAITERPDLVDGPPRHRPSPETRLRTARRTLPGADRPLVRAIADGQLEPEDPTLAALPAGRRARVLDVAYEQLRYEFLARQVSEEASRGLSHRILLARSRIRGPDVAPDPITVETPAARPDQGHESSRVSVRAGWRDDEPFLDLQLRPAFHGLLDDDRGFPAHMQIHVLDTRVRIYPDDGRLRLQELTLIEAASLSPRSHVFRPWAWHLATGLRTRRVPDHDELEDAPVWGTEAEVGLAWDPHDTVLLYGLAGGRFDVGPDLDDDLSLGPGGRAGVFLGRHGALWKGHLFGEATRFLAGETTTRLRGGVEARLSTSRNTAIVVEGSANRLHGESWLEGSLRLDLHF